MLWDTGPAKCQSAPPSLPWECPSGAARPPPSLSSTLSLLQAPRILSCLVLGKLSLGEVPTVPAVNPEGGGLGWSELNFLSI